MDPERHRWRIIAVIEFLLIAGSISEWAAALSLSRLRRLLFTLVPSDRLKFSGSQLKYRSLKADSGRTMQRGFCSECGSPVSTRRPETPLVEFLHAASLDDSSKFHPTCEVWVSRAGPWHPIHSTAQKFDQNPAAEAVRRPIEAYFAARAQVAPQR